MFEFTELGQHVVGIGHPNLQCNAQMYKHLCKHIEADMYNVCLFLQRLKQDRMTQSKLVENDTEAHEEIKA